MKNSEFEPRTSQFEPRIGYPFWFRPLLWRGVAAITLGRHIYVAADVAEEDRERIIRHERVHVRQIEAVGSLRFYWRYLREYAANRWAGMTPDEAYRRISFEQEAHIIETSGNAEPE
jgi:hypothetical protein